MNSCENCMYGIYMRINMRCCEITHVAHKMPFKCDEWEKARNEDHDPYIEE